MVRAVLAGRSAMAAARPGGKAPADGCRRASARHAAWPAKIAENGHNPSVKNG